MFSTDQPRGLKFLNQNSNRYRLSVNVGIHSHINTWPESTSESSVPVM